MKLRMLIAPLLALSSLCAMAQISLEQCLAKAEENYPLIKKYDLIAQTQSLSLDEINKMWLPGVNVYAQGSGQNAVAEFPAALTDLMAQMGREMKGLSHWQYKVGLDVTQTIWDGGATAAQRKALRASSSENEAQLAVSLYSVRERVMSLYFGALLTQEQIRQQEVSIELLRANLNKIRSMIAGGVAMQSDADNVEAQLLSALQKVTEARGALGARMAMLSLYVGEDLQAQQLLKPAKLMPGSMTSNRPELTLFNAQTARNDARRAEIKTGLMPKVSAFMQSFYGYPGFNNFEAMMNRKLSFNIIGGIKIQWNLNQFYTRNSALQKIEMANRSVAAERETFLFNSSLQSSGQSAEIRNLEEVISSDADIIRLRASVRKAAEAQLDNGVIDTVSLLGKLTDETQARLNADFHEIKLLQTIYQLKYTLNQ